MFGKSSGGKTMKWVSLLKDLKDKVGLTQAPASASSTPSSSPFKESSSSNANDMSLSTPDFWSSPSRLCSNAAAMSAAQSSWLGCHRKKTMLPPKDSPYYSPPPAASGGFNSRMLEDCSLNMSSSPVPSRLQSHISW